MTKKSIFGPLGILIRCIMGELLTWKILFDGRGSSYCQMEKIYEKLGDPLISWPEFRHLPLFNEVKPRKNFCYSLDSYLKNNTFEI